MINYMNLLANIAARIVKPKRGYPTPPTPRIDTTKYMLPDHQYIKEVTKKTGICLHHTVSGTANSVYNWWLDKGKSKVVRVGTAYVIDTDGTIYQFFDDKYWAFHLGKGVDLQYEKSFIGIEIVSEGGLTPKWNGTTMERNMELYSFGGEQKHRSEFVDVGRDWRGYRFFDQYEPQQISSVMELVNHLCTKHNIQRTMQSNLWEANSHNLKNGIITHAQVRADKTDVHPLFPTDQLVKYCGVEMVL